MSTAASNDPLDGLVPFLRHLRLRLLPAEGNVEPCLTNLQSEGQGVQLLVFPGNSDRM